MINYDINCDYRKYSAICLNCGLMNEDVSDHCRYGHCLSSGENLNVYSLKNSGFTFTAAKVVFIFFNSYSVIHTNIGFSSYNKLGTTRYTLFPMYISKSFPFQETTSQDCSKYCDVNVSIKTPG